jgi:hypothetical protein
LLTKDKLDFFKKNFVNLTKSWKYLIKKLLLVRGH